uniref:Uncharacterized protein n=1 Tax=Zooxanthella nutricula TaxID=1333877 RepID=A0A6U9C5C1_9DINO|mmetsp:Transcript_47387/g.144187  ORF Transcript_47387/g.144187 Transcript_47387/m.144187 type:complete len:475 (+) Transcript_47387:81-1505(+)
MSWVSKQTVRLGDDYQKVEEVEDREAQVAGQVASEVPTKVVSEQTLVDWIRGWDVDVTAHWHWIFSTGGRKAILEGVDKEFAPRTWTDVHALVNSSVALLEKEMGAKFAYYGKSMVPTNEDDLEAFRALINTTFALGAFNFVSAPLTFFLAFRGFTSIVYFYIAAKFLLSGIYQRRMCEQLAALMRKCGKFELAQAIDQQLSLRFFVPGSGLMGLLMGLVRAGMWCGTSLSAVAEAIDPDLDSMTAGGSWSVLKATQVQTFASSWRDVPVVGLPLVYLGLPGTLTAALAIAWTMQVRELLNYRTETSRVVAMDFRSMLNEWSHSADVGGVLLVHRVVFEAWQAEQALRGAVYPPDKGAGFVVKIAVEALPSAWFAITYYSLIFEDVSFATSLNVLVSILTSLNVILGEIKLHFPYLKRSYYDGRWSGDWSVQRLLLWYMAASVLLVVMTVRLMGVYACPGTHVFQVSQFRCLEA